MPKDKSPTNKVSKFGMQISASLFFYRFESAKIKSLTLDCEGLNISQKNINADKKTEVEAALDNFCMKFENGNWNIGQQNIEGCLRFINISEAEMKEILEIYRKIKLPLSLVEEKITTDNLPNNLSRPIEGSFTKNYLQEKQSSLRCNLL